MLLPAGIPDEDAAIQPERKNAVTEGFDGAWRRGANRGPDAAEGAPHLRRVRREICSDTLAVGLGLG